MRAGKELEKEVLQLMKLQGWQTNGEILIGPKKVDGYAERWDEYGVLQKIAIECKDYEKNLGVDEVTSVYADYLPLLDKGLIDQILLVTRGDLSPAAKAYAVIAKGLKHLTLAKLLYNAIGFAPYVEYMIDEIKMTGLDRYYVPQEWSDSTDSLQQSTAVDEVLAWVKSDETQPLAILGGYGMGKTTLARYLCYLLAEQHHQNPSERIPILLQLGQLSGDQTLDGLLGRQFTSLIALRGYSYHVFMKLNSYGRFVIFLDGFDEMKRFMTWESMRFNLIELNQLIVPNSKVVLLGRPNVFLTQAEHDEALHGKRYLVGRERCIPGWPNYRELHLMPFSEEKIRQFVAYYSETVRHGRGPDIDRCLSYRHRHQLLDIMQRPVHLQMLTEILPEYRGPIDRMTIAVLYTEFVEYVIARELRKRGRRGFSIKSRRAFASELAYWLWDRNADGAAISEMPESLFRKYVSSSGDMESTRRDLLCACFLERKPPEYLYFPHPSFQEFLVASHLSEMVGNYDRTIYTLRHITTEIVRFFLEIVGHTEVECWAADLVVYDGPITEVSAALLGAACAFHNINLKGKERESLKTRGAAKSFDWYEQHWRKGKMMYPKKWTGE